MPPSVRDLIVRALTATVIVIGAAFVFRAQLVEALLPAVRAALVALDDQFRIVELDVRSRGAEEVLHLRVDLAGPLNVGAHTIDPKPGGWLQVSTPVGTVLLPILTALIVALAWPAAAVAERLLRIVMSAAMSAIIVAVDAALDLLANVWNMFIGAYDPTGIYWIWEYHGFMAGGGRYLVGGLTGMIAILAAANSYRVFEAWKAVGREAHV